MAGTHSGSVWDVVISESSEGSQPGGDAAELAIVKKTEVEARQVFAEAVANAERLGYRNVRLRSDGVDVETWPG